MRKGLRLFLIVNLLFVGFLVHSVFTLLRVLVEDGREDAISRAEIPAPSSGLIDEQPQLIPKIIHQTYVNESIPAHWKGPQQSCIDMHEDYEYKVRALLRTQLNYVLAPFMGLPWLSPELTITMRQLWTDEKSRDFIAAEYPWFLETFESYPQSIQRADAIRYFVLAHFGGVYVDLDDGCNRRLDPLLSYPAWVRKTIPTGISNDVMACVPRHPFFLRVIESLQSYNRNWRLPYITVMYSTGPLFLSVIWKEYTSEHPAEENRVRVLMPDEYNRHAWSFFTHHKGSSWHGKDARLIFWMGRHWMLLTALGFTAAGLVGLCTWWIWGRILLLGARQKANVRGRRFSPFRLPSFRKEGYELVDRNHQV